MSNKIPCSGCGKIYPLWIAADAKPANCSECGARVEQRQVQPVIVAEPNPTPPVQPESTNKPNFGLIFFNTAIIGVALLLIIAVIGVGIVLYKFKTPTEQPNNGPITDVRNENSLVRAVGLVKTAMARTDRSQTKYFQFVWETKSHDEIEETYNRETQLFIRRSFPTIQNLQLMPSFSSGSCFLITADGFAITNHHVVEAYLVAMEDRLIYKQLEDQIDDNVSITPELLVYLDGIHHGAEVVYDSTEYDFAILKIDGISDYPFFRLSSMDSIPRLTKVTALGFPASSNESLNPEEDMQDWKNEGSRDPRNWFKDSDLVYVATPGEVSKVSERGSHGLVVQHTATIDSGNSGGPLVTDGGIVVGINTWKTTKLDDDGFVVGVGMNLSLSIHSVFDEIAEQNSEIKVKWVNSLP